MRVMRFNDQKNLTELVEQLFKLGKTPGTKSAALNAMADANPGLDLRGGRLGERLGAGTLLVVPEVDGATHTGRSSELGDEAANSMLKRIEVVISDALRVLEESNQRSADHITSRIDVLESQELQQAAAADPRVQERLASLVEHAKGSMQQLSEQRSRNVEVLRAATETASTLVELLRAGD
ncbi:MAG: hypothetical protein LH477_00575 [Nocardioides sp.]|nr:hypothetical protein [Nocardioides sp.]